MKSDMECFCNCFAAHSIKFALVKLVIAINDIMQPVTRPFLKIFCLPLISTAEAPSVVVHPQSLAFSQGDEIRLVCSASGSPPPRLFWSQGNVFLTNRPR